MLKSPPRLPLKAYPAVKTTHTARMAWKVVVVISTNDSMVGEVGIDGADEEKEMTLLDLLSCYRQAREMLLSRLCPILSGGY